MTVGISHQVTGICLLSAYNPLGILVAHHQTVVAVGYHRRCDCLHLLMDAVDSGSDGSILVGDVLALDKLGDEPSVGSDKQLAHIGELGTGLCDGNLLAVKVLHLDSLEDLM